MKMQKIYPIIETRINLLGSGNNVPANFKADPTGLHYTM